VPAVDETPGIGAYIYRHERAMIYLIVLLALRWETVGSVARLAWGEIEG